MIKKFTLKNQAGIKRRMGARKQKSGAVEWKATVVVIQGRKKTKAGK